MVHVHRLTSAPGRGLMAVRPDGHVGFRGQTADLNQLTAWLADMAVYGAPTTAGPGGRKSQAPGGPSSLYLMPSGGMSLDGTGVHS